MANKKTVKTALFPTEGETRKRIEEAAYYSFLNRGRYAQLGNEMNDWIEAEREVIGNALAE
jgi:hypothetical protein